jgi:60S ribosome subunit biogenesis protein NIP7
MFELREPRKKETKVIESAIKYFGSEILGKIAILESKTGFEPKRREVYLLSEELYDFLERVNVDPLSAGLKLGEVGRRFRFTVEGAFFIVKKKKKRVYVNEKGEMLFLYGRDIFSESVVKATSDIGENDIVFVCNKAGDILGIGRSRYEAGKLRSVEKDRVVVENLVDRGEYLRKRGVYDSF